MIIEMGRKSQTKAEPYLELVKITTYGNSVESLYKNHGASEIKIHCDSYVVTSFRVYIKINYEDILLDSIDMTGEHEFIVNLLDETGKPYEEIYIDMIPDSGTLGSAIEIISVT